MQKFLSLFLFLSLLIVPSVMAQDEASNYDGFFLGVEYIEGFDDLLNDFSEVSPVDISITQDFVSNYMWRGQELGNGDFSWQPGVEISPKGEPIGDLVLGWWASIAPDTAGKDFTEQDLYAGYSFDLYEWFELFQYESPSKIFDFNVDFGYIYYDFPASATKSQELYFGLTYNTILSPSFYIYHDFEDPEGGRGEWLELGISHNFEFEAFTIETYATLGYNHKQWANSDTSKFSTLDFGAALPIPVGEHMSLTPFISYTYRVGDTYATTGGNLTQDQLYGGVSYSLNF